MKSRFWAAAAAGLWLCAPAAMSHEQELELAGSPVCSVTNMPGSTACAGAFEGNNTNGGMRALVLDELADLSGLGGWRMVATYWTERAPTGTLALLAPVDGAFAIALKAANKFSLYYFNGVGPAISSLSYSTVGTSVNRQGLPQGLSHATFYTTSVVPVPEPETYAMLLAGLAAIGFVTRRRMS